MWGWGAGLGNKQGEETDKGAPVQGVVSLDPPTGFIREVVFPPPPHSTDVSTEGS